MKKQKQVARIINSLCIFAVIFLNKHSFISLICIVAIMVLNFWNLMSWKKGENNGN